MPITKTISGITRNDIIHKTSLIGISLKIGVETLTNNINAGYSPTIKCVNEIIFNFSIISPYRGINLLFLP